MEYLLTLPTYLEDDGTLWTEGRSAITLAELCRDLLAAGFSSGQSLIIRRRRDNHVIERVPAIGDRAKD